MGKIDPSLALGGEYPRTFPRQVVMDLENNYVSHPQPILNMWLG